MKIDFLFIRLIEACNAGCSMCNFAKSKDKFRLDLEDYQYILDKAKSSGICHIRFTGGEPLLHQQIIDIIAMTAEKGLRTSIITNGLLLPRFVNKLNEAKLYQIIVSLDGVSEIHDRIRNINGLFDQAINGLKACQQAGIRTRVNTVCGPNNYLNMPKLQNLLTKIGVEQWELSSLKLEKKLDYIVSDKQQEEIQQVIKFIYKDGKKNNRLVPMGKIWCGETKKEQTRYFETGCTPAPDNCCHIVDRVRYLDTKNKEMYVCSLIPHRPIAKKYSYHIEDFQAICFNNEKIEKQVQFFKKNGPLICQGCSSTAAGISNAIEDEHELDELWY